MADNAAEKVEAPAPIPDQGQKSKPSFLLLGIVLLNSIAFIGVGVLLYMNKQSEMSKPSMEPIVAGAMNDTKEGLDDGGYSIPLDFFLVNLAEEQGHKLFKVKMEFDVDSAEVQEEINKRMPQVRDIIIILLSSRTYSQISTPKGKERLKEEIRDTVNSFLTKGKINKVLFTQFLNN